MWQQAAQCKRTGLGTGLQWGHPCSKGNLGSHWRQCCPCSSQLAAVSHNTFPNLGGLVTGIFLFLHCCFSLPSSSYFTSPLKFLPGYSVHHSLPKSSTGSQVILACICTYCLCVRILSIISWHYPYWYCSLSHTQQKSNSGDQLSPFTCPQATEPYRRGTQHLTVSVPLTSIEPFSANRKSHCVSLLFLFHSHDNHFILPPLFYKYLPPPPSPAPSYPGFLYPPFFSPPNSLFTVPDLMIF